MSASLNEACMAGNVEEVLMRLNLGEDVNQKLFPRYTTALHDATTCGRVGIVKILIERSVVIKLGQWLCDSVGRAVASDTRGLQFKSSHWQKLIYILNICLLSTVY